ncbi:Hypothetical protein CINCED_3A002816 [Cinara cedri]|uniref:CYTH domain-containing protein n=1 Tax=Cinara cedri TaxID=506608 RepID=A0A5E4N7L2_9HEMI|nr:Hypothetical protein CINCED_3A002816 [Cinara cedri]
MSRNVEIKARVKDLEFAKERILHLNSELCKDSDPKTTVLNQEDVFYNLPNTSTGKLKFRKIEGFPPELIYYDREESTGPKLSTYHKCEVPENLSVVLTKALGTWGIVKKSRTLIMVGQTRVHFDNVEGLGCFVELEVVLKDDQTVEEGQCIAKNIMYCMGIEEIDLISISYVNMLNKNKS